MINETDLLGFKKVDLFEGLDPSILIRLAEKCTWQRFSKGTEIFGKSSTNRAVYFVASGAVRIVNYSLSGREIAYATLEAGSTFGELAAIDGNDRSATAVATTQTVLALMEPEDFTTMLTQQPKIALRVMRRLTAMIRACDERIMDLALLSAYQRVYRELVALCRPDPVNHHRWLIHPLPTQAQLAAQAGTTRETVARVLSQLAQSVVAERKGRTLYIRNLEKLTTLAEVTSPESVG